MAGVLRGDVDVLAGVLRWGEHFPEEWSDGEAVED